MSADTTHRAKAALGAELRELPGLAPEQRARRRQALAEVARELVRAEAHLRRFHHPEFGWLIRPLGSDRDLGRELDDIVEGGCSVVSRWRDDLPHSAECLEALCASLAEVRKRIEDASRIPVSGPAVNEELTDICRALGETRAELEPVLHEPAEAMSRTESTTNRT